MIRRFWILILGLLAFVVSLGAFAVDGQPAAATDPLPEKLYLPVMGVETSEQVVSSDRLQFTNNYWHLSFNYPGDWEVVGLDDFQFSRTGDDPDLEGRDSLRIRPTGAVTKTYISILNFSTQRSPGQSLEDWAQKKTKVDSLVMGVETRLTDTQTLVLPTESDESTEFFLGTFEIVVGDETYQNRIAYFASGQIMFAIWSSDPAYYAVMEEIVRSIRFAPDAPKTLDQLTGENRGELRQTIEGKLEMWTPQDDPDYCDLPCRDQKAWEAEGHVNPTVTPAPDSTP